MNFFSNNQDKSINLLTAPAGYGKTVLMQQLAEISQKPLVWYQLNANDNDPVVFLYYLTVGFRKRFPGFGEKLLEMLNHGNFKQHYRLLLRFREAEKVLSEAWNCIRVFSAKKTLLQINVMLHTKHAFLKIQTGFIFILFGFCLVLPDKMETRSNI